MGYYTKFDMYAYNVETREPISEEQEKAIAAKLWEITSGHKRFCPKHIDDVFEENMKWYDHEEDMMNLSVEYPNILFVLEGIGEEFPDAWRKWFHNGKFEESYAEITYPKPVNPLFAAFNF